MKFEQVLACVFSSFSSLHFGTILSSYIWYWTIKQEFKLMILLHSVLGGCDINIHSLAPSFLTPCLYQVALCFAFKPVLIHFGIYCVKYWKYFSQTLGHMMASLKNRRFVSCTQCGLLLQFICFWFIMWCLQRQAYADTGCFQSLLALMEYPRMHSTKSCLSLWTLICLLHMPLSHPGYHQPLLSLKQNSLQLTVWTLQTSCTHSGGDCPNWTANQLSQGVIWL